MERTRINVYLQREDVARLELVRWALELRDDVYWTRAHADSTR